MTKSYVHQHIEEEGRELPFLPADPETAGMLSNVEVRRYNEHGFLVSAAGLLG